jgi:UDP-hydrolysing UDP-N-acetyl-D-glucosamine 2-epimerase
MGDCRLRKIACLTVSRSDFGRYLPVLKALRGKQGVEFALLVSGSHLAAGFGNTWQEIKTAGYDWEKGLEMTLASDSPVALGKSLGLGVISLSQSFARDRPNLLFLLGDRYEMLAGACAALGFNIPIVHLHGGNLTEGAIDDSVRHALTKMSHVHLTSCEEHARRIRQMGEEDWRVMAVGAPILDGIQEVACWSKQELSERFGLDLGKPTLLFAFHPTTLESESVAWQTSELLEAVENLGMQVVMTYPNADPGHQTILELLKAFSQKHADRVCLVPHADTPTFLSLMRYCKAIVGNSSAGIVEAASFKLPCINVGTRQEGKLRAKHVIDVGYRSEEIAKGIARALSNSFVESLRDLQNPYGDGKSAERIVEILCNLEINPRLLKKKFVDRSWK